MSKIIACDFDGTLCENEFPNIGAPRQKIIDKLKREISFGSKVILWTCRDGEYLSSAVKWCEQRGIVFDAINDNLEEVKKDFMGNSRKVVATEYWDDRAVRV